MKLSEIIIADRDKEVLLLFSKMFGIYDFKCREFTRASALLWEALISRKHVFCILDIHFLACLVKKEEKDTSTLFNSLPAAEKMKKDLSFISIFEKMRPIVYITGAREPSSEEVKLMFRLKASFLEKPLTPFSLIELADKALEAEEGRP